MKIEELRTQLKAKEEKKKKEEEQLQKEIAEVKKQESQINVQDKINAIKKKAEENKKKLEEEQKKAKQQVEQQQQAWNEYVEKNGTDKINEKYQNYIQGVNQKIAPKLYQTSGMQELASKRTAVTASEIKEASDELKAYKAKKRY